MPEEGGDNLAGGKMAKGSSYLAQVVWPGLSSVPLQFGLMGFALSVCSCWAGRDQPGAELDPKRLRMCQWNPALLTTSAVLSVKQQLNFSCPCVRLSIPALKAHAKDISGFYYHGIWSPRGVSGSRLLV